jgi:hypothetical protein
VDYRRASHIASFPHVHPYELRDPIVAGQNPRAMIALRREDVGTARDLGYPLVIGNEDRVQMQWVDSGRSFTDETSRRLR